MRDLLRRVSGFALVPALSMVASLVLLPLIAVHDGAAGWTGMALGQSVGALIATVGGLAWPIVGAQRIVDASTPDLRRRVFALSLVTRGIVIGALCVVAGPIVWSLAAAGQSMAAMLFMCGAALTGLSASWYFSGTGQPRHLVVNEGFTRTAGYVVAIPLVAWTGSTVSYASCIVISGILALILNWRTVFHPIGFPRLRPSEICEVFRGQFTGTFSRVVNSLHLYAPTALLSAFIPRSVPLFTAIDNVYKTGGNAVTFLPSALIEWMQPKGGIVSRRKNMALGICIAVALGISVVWPLVGHWIMGYLYQGKLDGGGVWIQMIGLSVGLGLIVLAIEFLEMIPRGEEGRVFTVEWVASLVGVAAVIPMAQWLGGGGAFVTYPLSSLLKLLLFAIPGARRRRACPVVGGSGDGGSAEVPRRAVVGGSGDGGSAEVPRRAGGANTGSSKRPRRALVGGSSRGGASGGSRGRVGAAGTGLRRKPRRAATRVGLRKPRGVATRVARCPRLLVQEQRIMC